MLRYFHNRPSDGSTASGYIVLDPTTQLRALSERAFAILTEKCSYNLVAETPVRRVVGGGWRPRGCSRAKRLMAGT
jgi:hypothetical protein